MVCAIVLGVALRAVSVHTDLGTQLRGGLASLLSLFGFGERAHSRRKSGQPRSGVRECPTSRKSGILPLAFSILRRKTQKRTCTRPGPLLFELSIGGCTALAQRLSNRVSSTRITVAGRVR